MNFKGVIFDLDGTLADTLEDIAGSMNTVLKNNGYPEFPVNDYKLLVGRGIENLVKQSLPEYARQENIISKCFKEFTKRYDEYCLVKTRPYPGIEDLLNELISNNIKVAVFSNKAEPLTLKIVNALLGTVPFVKISGARPDVPKKPDPSGALQIASMMNLLPEDVVYVGDSDVDMITATSAGMYAVGVKWGFRSEDELLTNGAKMILTYPTDLLTLP